MLRIRDAKVTLEVLMIVNECGLDLNLAEAHK